MLGIAVSTTLSGRAIARTGRYKRFPIAGLALMTVALVLLAAFAGDPSQVATGIALAVFGLGFGMVTQVLIVAVQNSVDRRELGVATATTGFFRALGGAVGRRRPRRRVRGAGRRARVGAAAHALRADVIDGVQAVFLVAAPLAALALARRAAPARAARCRPPTASHREDQMASAFSTAVALRGEQSGGRDLRDREHPARPLGRPAAAPPRVRRGVLRARRRAHLPAARRALHRRARARWPSRPAASRTRSPTSATRLRATCCSARRRASRATSPASPREAAGEDPPPWALAPTPPVTTVGGQIGERDDIAAATPIAPAGDHFNVVVRGEQNDGRVGVMLNRMPPGATGPPLHHHAFDEMFYVLEGELTFQLEDELVTKRAGELVFVPGGVAHAFTNRGDAPARFADRLHARRLRAPLRAQRRRGGGRRSACLGHAAHTARHEGRAADRRVTDEFRRAARS